MNSNLDYDAAMKLAIEESLKEYHQSLEYSSDENVEDVEDIELDDTKNEFEQLRKEVKQREEREREEQQKKEEREQQKRKEEIRQRIEKDKEALRKQPPPKPRSNPPYKGAKLITTIKNGWLTQEWR